MNTLVKTVLILVAASIAFAAGFLAQPENTVAAKAEPGASVIVPASGASGKAESVNPGDDESRLWSLVQAANSPWRLVEMEKEIAGLNFEQTLAAIERAKRTGTETRRALFHMLIVHAHGLSRERLREFIAPELTAMFASSSGMFGTRPALTWLTLYPDEALSIGKGRSSTSRHLLIGVYLAQMLVNQGAEGSAIQFPEDISLQEKGNISYSVMSEALRAGRLRDALPLLDVVETPMRAYLVERILESFTDKNRDPFGGLRMAQELRTKFGASVISPEQIEGIFSGIAANDISAAMKALETLPPEERTAAEFGILPQWIVKDPTAALAFAAGTGLLANEHFAENIGEIVAKNPVGILAAVHKMSPGTDRENAALILANSEHEWESPDALDTLLSSDARFQWELAAAAKAGKLVALIRALPSEARARAFDFAASESNMAEDFPAAFPSGADRDLLLLAAARVETTEDAMSLAAQISSPELRAKAYSRIAAASPQLAHKNAGLMKSLPPELAEFYRRYPNEGGTNGFASFLPLLFGFLPDRGRYELPDKVSGR